MSRGLRSSLSLLLVAGLVVLTGLEAGAQTPKKGGVLKVAVLGDPPTLDSHWTTANFVVHLSAVQAADVTVDYATQNGSATAPADYTAASGTAKIPAGSLTTVIPVSIVGDTLSEGNETFTVKLSNPSGSHTIADDTADGGGAVTRIIKKAKNPTRATVTAAIAAIRAAPSDLTNSTMPCTCPIP